MDDLYAALWNQKDYHGLATQLYHHKAVVIPPNATNFIEHSSLEHLFPQMQDYWGSSMNLTANVVVMEEGSPPSTIHEIGSYGGVTNKYYQRWTNDTGSWMIAFSSMAIGGAPEGSKTLRLPTKHHDPFKMVADHDKVFSDEFNNQNWTAVAALYNPRAQLIPPTCDGYVLQPQLAAFFEAAHGNGINTINLEPVVVLQENKHLIHEIGGNKVNGANSSEPYYVRWMRNGSDWQLAFDIMAIGTGQ